MKTNFAGVLLLSLCAPVAATTWQCTDFKGRVYLDTQQPLVDECKILDLREEREAPNAKPVAKRKKVATSAPKSGVRIGMTQDQARASNWGKPQDINRTTTAHGTHEQWVYGGHNYLYFEDGILTSIQN